MEPLDQYSNIQPLVQKEIDDKINAYADQAKFNVAQIPAHAHTGVDSTRIDYLDIIGTPAPVVATPTVAGKLYQGSQQGYQAATLTVTLNSNAIDEGVAIDTGAYTITIETAGVYCIIASVGWDNVTADCKYWTYICKGGTPIKNSCVQSSITGALYVPCSDVVTLAVGDVISLQASQDSGNNMYTRAGADDTSLSIFKV